MSGIYAEKMSIKKSPREIEKRWYGIGKDSFEINPFKISQRKETEDDQSAQTAIFPKII